MTAVAEKIQQKPWENEHLPFNTWYRKRLQADFGTALNMINLTRDFIRNGGNKGDIYQTFLSNLHETQSRLTQLLFELEEADMELALKINDSICGTLDWAKKSEVSSLLPEIPNTNEVSKLVAEMTNEKTQSQIKYTDEQKVGDVINIELKVGVGPTAQIKCLSVPRGSTLLDLKNSIPNLKRRSQITFVRQGLKVEETTVVLNGDSIIAVLSSTEGVFQGFDDPQKKTVSIQPISPPPDSKKQLQNVPAAADDFLTSVLNQTPAKDAVDFEVVEPDDKNLEPADVEIDISIETDSKEQGDNNPFGQVLEQPKHAFDLMEEQSKPSVVENSKTVFDPLLEQPKPDVNANPFQEFENNDEDTPLMTFDRFNVGGNNETTEVKAKETNEATEKDNLLGDSSKDQEAGKLEKQDSFPTFAGFS